MGVYLQAPVDSPFHALPLTKLIVTLTLTANNGCHGCGLVLVLYRNEVTWRTHVCLCLASFE